ncbi:hypothetical protein GCM10010530_72110 [Kribbella aluminosa]
MLEIVAVRTGDGTADALGTTLPRSSNISSPASSRRIENSLKSQSVDATLPVLTPDRNRAFAEGETTPT